MMHPTYRHIRNKTLVVGTTAIGIGIFGAILPFLPGTLFFLIGLSLLSLQSKMAHHLLAIVRARYPRLTNVIAQGETRLINFFDLTTHKREYVSITNTGKGLLSILAEPTTIKAGVAILLHSASGVSETRAMETLAESFRVRGLTVIRFDAHNGLGDENGDTSAFTATDYREDLARIIAWAREQLWWQRPFVLCGHSLGGLIAALYAAEHPGEVDELVLLAPTVSGASYERACATHDPDMLEKWKKDGYKVITHPLTKEEHYLSYHFMEDLGTYNLLNVAHSLSMPVTILSGTEDTVAPTEDVQELCNAIGEHALLLRLTGTRHTPETHEEVTTLRNTLGKVPVRRYDTYITDSQQNS